MQITRMGLEGAEAATGRTKEEHLTDIYKALLKRRNETDQDILDVVTGEGRGIIIGQHTFAGSTGPGVLTTTVQIDEILPGTTYGTVVTMNTGFGSTSAPRIDNKTDRTFDVKFNSTGSGTRGFTWMVVY